MLVLALNFGTRDENGDDFELPDGIQNLYLYHRVHFSFRICKISVDLESQNFPSASMFNQTNG